VVLEYTSEGHVVGTGRRYANRYISVLTLREREVAHWRDYLDPVRCIRRARLAATLTSRRRCSLCVTGSKGTPPGYLAKVRSTSDRY
jgi:hypothetical protein